MSSTVVTLEILEINILFGTKTLFFLLLLIDFTLNSSADTATSDVYVVELLDAVDVLDKGLISVDSTTLSSLIRIILSLNKVSLN